MRLAIGASPDKAAQKTAPEKAVAEGGGALASSELGRDLAQLPQAELVRVRLGLGSGCRFG